MLANRSRSWRLITSLVRQRGTTHQQVRDAIVDTTSVKERCRSSSWATAAIKSGQIADRDKPGGCHGRSPQCVARSHGSERSSCLEKLTWPPSKVRALLLAPTQSPRVLDTLQEGQQHFGYEGQRTLNVSRSNVHRVHEGKNVCSCSSREPQVHVRNTIHVKEVVKISVVSLV